MPNITLSIDEETYQRARVLAATQRTTVSALTRQYLQSLVRPQNSSAKSKALFSALDEVKSFSAQSRMSREQAHER